MGSTVRLTAEDGFTLDAYRAEPSGAPQGGLVLVQEIFGVNHHIRSVADDYAAQGYLVIAPALFDRAEPHYESAYDQAGMQRGIATMQKLNNDDALKDIAAALKALDGAGSLGIVGYCWGGTLSWLSAGRLDGLKAAVVYYGGGIGSASGLVPRCPVLAHFGEQDTHIPAADIDKIRPYPNVEVHMYPAGHGFNCSERGSYDAPSATQARERTLAFLGRELG